MNYFLIRHMILVPSTVVQQNVYPNLLVLSATEVCHASFGCLEPTHLGAPLQPQVWNQNIFITCTQLHVQFTPSSLLPTLEAPTKLIILGKAFVFGSKLIRTNYDGYLDKVCRKSSQTFQQKEKVKEVNWKCCIALKTGKYRKKHNIYTQSRRCHSEMLSLIA